MADLPQGSAPSGPPTVVGIGASAGGLAALKEFFAHVPGDSGLAFVVVLHLSPDHESHLADVLRPHVRMPVQQVRGTVPLKANCVYLIPPNANLDAIDSHLRLSELEARRRDRAPIDHFFRTLARTHDGHTIGLILSGSGNDGSLGIKAIKEKGGLTIVQAPSEAEYAAMPKNAIATGQVDLVLPLREIPRVVLGYIHTQPRVVLTDDERKSGTEPRPLLPPVLAEVRAVTGREFDRYKPTTILRRIARRMQLRLIEDPEAYLKALRSDPDEVRALADDFLVTVTSFFRDPKVFERLSESVVPQILARKAGNDPVRVWTVGCATGEEAYSLAILFLEESARHEAPPPIQIFASDLHDHSLKQAREGFYLGDIRADVTPERLRRHFLEEDGGYRIRKEVRERVTFARHNLLGDPPFSRLDLIACRNLLIYLQRDIQKEVAELFHHALRPEGFLVVGSSESVDHSDLFHTEHKKSGIYRRRDVPTPEPRLPVFPNIQLRVSSIEEGSERTGRPFSYGDLHARMVERYAPPSLVLSPEDNVVHVSEHAGRYLLHPGGELTSNAFKLLREELRIDLRAALSEARHGKPTRSRPIAVQFEGQTHAVVLDVRPALEPKEQGFVLVLFDEESTASESRHSASRGRTTDRSKSPEPERERELTMELDLMRQRLQQFIEEHGADQEEMKAANEELQSSNEELRSTLEELETSKEELHSMNEELATMNQENRHKVEELARLSDDLRNFLAATDIATLFLDRELRIMRFTPPVEKLFNMRFTDRGRRLSDITHRLDYATLNDDATAVLSRQAPLEREVSDTAGNWYLTRLLPYRLTQDQVDGVVITFVEITRRKEAEKALRSSEEKLKDKTRLLEEEDQRKTFFLATLGHELRNPLAALDNAIKVIERGAESPPKLHQLMQAQIDQLKILVNDLLEISRITRGKVTLHKTPVDLARIIRVAAQTLESSLRLKHQDLVLTLQEPLLLVGDEIRLEQIFANLLSNASKYTPDGQRIDVLLQREGDGAVATVRDKGCGLATEDLNEIFEPFIQKDPHSDGLGIGLALVKLLVELHGGTVKAESEGTDRGSVFTVRLPIEDVDAAKVEVVSGTERRAGPALLPAATRVLIVDDNRDLADTLRILLNLEGIQAACAYSGREGVEKARSWHPHAALIDIGLPDISGYEVAKRLRGERDADEILLLAMTGFGESSVEEKASAAGFAERLVKPVDHERVCALVAMHMNSGKRAAGQS